MPPLVGGADRISRYLRASVSELEGGVFCNFGSAVLGPEVFLKALSIVRNLGYTVKVFTTANFDLIPLADYRKPIGDDVTDYYYRPRKNIVNRPVSLGGRGYHITGDHNVTIPNLHHLIVKALAEDPKSIPEKKDENGDLASKSSPTVRLEEMSSHAHKVLKNALQTNPELQPLSDSLVEAFRTLELSFSTGGRLFIGGNGGSMADALHISGELDKAYKLKRPIRPGHAQRLSQFEDGDELAKYLQVGLPTIALGVNASLSSAVDNDVPLAHIGIAQELYALAHSGDVFMGISTSGNAKNVYYAALAAKAIGLSVIGMTGRGGGRLGDIADVVIRAPEIETAIDPTMAYPTVSYPV